MKRLTSVLAAIGLLSLTSPLLADNIRINGFGSIVAASVVDGPGYIAEYPNLGIYDDDTINFAPESRLGLQFQSQINNKFNFTTQFMMRGANDYEPQITWAYLGYQVSDDSTLQAGRLRVPVYHFSEFMDVGYAYTWARIPADTYSLDLINYNGVRYIHNISLSDSTLSVMGIYGSQSNQNDKLMSYLFPTQIDRTFDDVVGIVFDWDRDTINLRSSYVSATMLETRHLGNFLATNILGIPANILYPSPTNKVDASGDSLVAFDSETDISFFDVSAKWQLGQTTLFAEYNEYDPFYKSYFASIGYRVDLIEYYLIYSKFDLNQAWESHDTTAIGLRYDFDDGIALKVDFSMFNDTGFNPFTGDPNPVYQGARTTNGGDGNGDASILTFAIDFVF